LQEVFGRRRGDKMSTKEREEFEAARLLILSGVSHTEGVVDSGAILIVQRDRRISDLEAQLAESRAKEYDPMIHGSAAAKQGAEAVADSLLQQARFYHAALLNLRDDYKHYSEQYKRIQWILDIANDQTNTEPAIHIRAIIQQEEK
jgi:hypothetical protein